MTHRPLTTPDPVWEAVNSEGDVIAVWVEQGGNGPEQIRGYRDKHYSGTPLRVTRFTATTEWDES